MPRRDRPGHARTPGATRLVAVAAVALVAGAAAGLMGARDLREAAEAPPVASPVAAVEADDASPVPAASSSPAPSPSATVEPEPEPQPVQFTLVAAGDVLPHTPVNDSARTADGYDFAALMKGVERYVAGADLALCHMEVPVSPAGVAPSGYPLFSAPKQLVRDLGKVGWDGCSTASNHTVDRGTAGVEATLDAFDAAGLQHSGSARTKKEAASTAMYEVTSGDRTVTVANISFSYGTNGMPVASPWQVDLFDADDADAGPIIAAARQARKQGADVVIASVHCCVEYRTEPTDAQRSIATQIAESGQVDLYVGHHAHVPQPIELLPGGPTGEGMWTAFGLGNFLSNQGTQCCVAATTNGVLLSATFTVDPDGAVEVDAAWYGTTVDRLARHAVHVLTDIRDGVGTLSAGEVGSRLAAVRDAVGDEAPMRKRPVEPLADEVVVVPRTPSAT
ncbi:CapA family protein [Demequina sp. SYSU T00192]|uniref:CapA family protein n=1 Tax=Demequina litoralis TaxID=3051660 RepID=A0ABT8GAI8_9MICO|nr:CapA family protein [Demequina sp. SYSU T00192]MDN4476150.1 CapA family protein [Demequina sp. SYSU T00192]